MARPRSGLIALAAAALLALALPGSAFAQSGLRTLHVEALAMRADRARLAVGDVFHLAIHVRVAENVAALDELVVPDLGSMRLLGDERRTRHGTGGTEVVETLTLEPSATGRVTFSPAYLDAVDARTGRPSRFSSNAVTVVVGAAPAVIPWRALSIALLVLLALAAAIAVFLAARRRAPAAPVAIAATPAPASEPQPPRQLVADALRTYRVAPSARALEALRARLFEAAGAPRGGTLRDALLTAGASSLRAALIAAERASFGPAGERDAASAALVESVETWLAREPAQRVG